MIVYCIVDLLFLNKNIREIISFQIYEEKMALENQQLKIKIFPQKRGA